MVHRRLASPAGSPQRARYLFRDGRGPDGAAPPNNWPSVFGGPAWTRITTPDGSPGQWYRHTFAAAQPDLDWGNGEVREDLVRTLRFWLDRGVYGFRIDVAHGMAKPAGLPDMAVTDNHLLHNTNEDQRFDRYLSLRRAAPGFNFRLLETTFDAAAVREAIEHSSAAVARVQAPATWTLANHDAPRQVTRYGGGEAGYRRARTMALVELALPREGEVPSFGFSATAETWLPMPAEWSDRTAEVQLEDAHSILSLYRRVLELRAELSEPAAELEWFGAPRGCCAFRRRGGRLVCALNTSGAPVPLPSGEVLLSSVALVDGQLPPDAAVWLS